MSTLNSTKYKIPSRVVSGTVSVLPDDTILQCDTDNAAVTINLALIPDDYWQTSYKLYVQDFSGGAATNNITINAGVGQYINGLSSYVMADTDSLAVITIISNNSYLLTYVSDQSTGQVQILNEGVSLTNNVSSINFTGDGVTASAVGNAVTVNVPSVIGGFIAVVSLTSKTLPISGSSTRRVASGTIFNNANSLSYDTVLEYGSFAGASTFDATTGIWTCPATGYYDITCFLALIANANPNENAITPNYWQGNGTGSANIEAIAATPHNIDFNEYIGSFGVCAEGGGIIYCQQHVPVYFDNSCINISGTYTGRYVAQGTQIYCRFLNKTQLIGGGVAGSSFHFSVKRVY